LTKAARSRVLELIIGDALGSTGDGPVVVCGAGNGSVGYLAFPARFESAVAVSSVNSAGQPSSYTNFDRVGNHPWLFSCYGGDDSENAQEWVAESTDHRYYGTSFAAAYASGVIAEMIRERAGSPSVALRVLARAVSRDQRIKLSPTIAHG
jgi:hypothetical protein